MKLLTLLGIGILVSSCGVPKDGKNGLSGVDGYSLVVDVVSQYSGGVQCQRTDIFQDLDRNNYYSSGDLYQNGFLVCDGKVGANGLDGEDGLDADLTHQVVEIFDPCGQEHSSGFDEVILKLGSGKYLASFSDNANGRNTRFSVLSPGTYQTTDGTNCTFTIE